MMKKNTDNFEHILKNALLEDRSLSADLVNETQRKLHNKEATSMRLNNKQPLKWAAAIIIGLMLTGVTGLATWQLLTPSEVADEFEQEELRIAFDSEDALHINESITSEGYIFTLKSIVSGEDLTDMRMYMDGDIRNDRTYAVVAIEQEDGTSMVESGSSFFISPYVHGFAPWQVNIARLGGGHLETFIDGVLYRIVDMENIEIFAERGVYLGISLGNFSFEAIDFDDETGEISLNPDFNGSSVLFDLPLDSSLADEERVQEILGEFFYDDEEVDEEDVGDEEDDPADDLDDIFGEEGGFMVTWIDEDGEERITTSADMNFAEMTYDELADFLEARIEMYIENGEPEGVIVGARRDRENWLRDMREYNIEFAEVWSCDESGTLSVSLTNPDYAE